MVLSSTLEKDLSEDIKKKVIQSLKWVVVGKVIVQLIRWSVTFWVVRLLTPTDFGIVALSDFYLDFLWMFAITGAGSAVIQKRNISKNALREFFTVILALNFVLFIILLLSADTLASLYEEPRMAEAIRISAYCFLIIAFQMIPSALLTREMDFKRLTFFNIFSQTVSSLSTLIMACKGMGFLALVYGEVVRLSIQTLLKYWYSPILVWPKISFREVRSLISFGSSVSIHRVLWHIYAHLDIAIAGLILSTADVGSYQVAVFIAAIPISKVIPSLKQVALPAYSQIQESFDKVQQYFLKSHRLGMYIILPIFFGISSISDLFIPVVFGDKWLNSVIPLTFLSLAMPFRFSEELFSPVLEGINQTNILIKNTILIIITMSVAIYIGSHYGIKGLSFSWLIGFSSIYIVVVCRICHSINIPLKQFFNTIKIPFLSSVVMYLAIKLTQYLIQNMYHDIISLLICIIVGITTYFLLSFYFNKSVFKELISLKKSGPSIFNN
jgi:lipopolysaccharide exporter